MNEDSPRYKRLFGFLTGATTEAELDAAMTEMTLEDHMARIKCPTLMLTGEYDHRDPLEEVYRLFDKITAPQGAVGVRRPVPPASLRRWSRGVRRPLSTGSKTGLRGEEMARNGEVIYLEPGSEGVDATTAHRQASLVRGGLKLAPPWRSGG